VCPQGLPNYGAIRSTLSELNKKVPLQNHSQQLIPFDVFCMKSADKIKLMCAHVLPLALADVQVTRFKISLHQSRATMCVIPVHNV
jgi:hypothetical protein